MEHLIEAFLTLIKVGSLGNATVLLLIVIIVVFGIPAALVYLVKNVLKLYDTKDVKTSAAIDVLKETLTKSIDKISSQVADCNTTLAQQINRDDLEILKTLISTCNDKLLVLLHTINEHVIIIDGQNKKVVTHLEHMNQNINKISTTLESLRSRIDDSIKNTDSIESDITSVLNEARNNHASIMSILSFQVQGLQKDIASLHGTIIGMSSTRNKIK